MSPLPKGIYEDLNKERVNSWAIWGDDFERKEKYTRFDHSSVSGLLKPNVVFLGLNPSKDLYKHNLINFHNPKHANDRKIKRAIQGSENKEIACPNLHGGFMTDLAFDQKIPNSNNVTVKSDHSKTLEDKLKQLNQPHYHLICFGNKTYETIQSWALREQEGSSGVIFGHTNNQQWELSIYKVVHFAAAVKTERFNQQLKTVDTLVAYSL